MSLTPNHMPIPPAKPESPPPLPPAFKGQGLRLGIFDSGLGGLSVLRAIRAHLPLADTIYVADSGFAPYGERPDDYIESRARHITQFLLSRGVDAVVVACNTATAVAVHHLREQWPQVPVVGVEPGVKPAVAYSTNKCIGVLATPLTLRSRKFQALIDTHGAQARIVLQPCPGLAKEIELGQLDTPALRALVAQFAAPLIEAGVDTAVLGCTHYPFVKPLFEAALGPQVRLIDTADAVALQTARIGLAISAQRQSAPQKTSGLAELWSSADPNHLSQIAGLWLGLTTQARPLR